MHKVLLYALSLLAASHAPAGWRDLAAAVILVRVQGDIDGHIGSLGQLEMISES